jgi:DAK2 domain fusion protein YloV
VLTADALLSICRVAEEWLSRNRDAINAINVYPVPDGDTGTNMLLTLRAALEAAERDGARSLSALSRAMARGALLGARGNSGVILSQMIRGLAEGFEGLEVADARGLSDALHHAGEVAYAAVSEPVEGTMLTVMRAACPGTLPSNADIAGVLMEAQAAAERAVKRTPEQLPRLREAGVVDAGGMGVAVILAGLRYGWLGEPLPEVEHQPDGVDLAAVEHEGHGYCTEYVLEGVDLDRDGLVTALVGAGGESVLVVGDPRTLHVHVHMADPGPALSVGAALGSLAAVKVDNMQSQHVAWAAQHEADLAPAAESEIPAVGLVAVVPGPGVAAAFRALGAVTITGAGGAKPSAGELLDAARRAGRERVLLLPNDKDVLMAAERAANESNGLVTIVPTRTVAAGLSAAIVYVPDANAVELAAAMVAAAAGVRCVEVTRAARASRVDGVDAQPGDPIALVDGTLVARADSLESALLAGIARATEGGKPEIITLILGADAPADAAESTRSLIEAAHPELEVEVIDGGQPHYPYIAGVE